MYTFKEKDFGMYEGKTYPLETPMLEGGPEPELNKPKRSGPDDPKKFVVYVKDPKTGNVRKINFGNEKDFDGGNAKIIIKIELRLSQIDIIVQLRKINYPQVIGLVTYRDMLKT
jgi:hypothetical protein